MHYTIARDDVELVNMMSRDSASISACPDLIELLQHAAKYSDLRRFVFDLDCTHSCNIIVRLAFPRLRFWLHSSAT